MWLQVLRFNPNRTIDLGPELERAVEVLDYPVAFAGGGFKALAIQDGHGSAQVFDQSRAFEHSRGQAYAGAARAQHLSKEFVGKGKNLRVDAILAHEEPAHQALLGFMQAVAGRELGHLHALHQGEAAQFGAQDGSARQKRFEKVQNGYARRCLTSA